MTHPALAIGTSRPTASIDKGKPAADFRSIPLDMISPNPRNPRRVFDETKLDELAASIKSRGLLQPIRVRRDPQGRGRFLIVAGHRRFLAHQRNKATHIDAIVAEERYGQDDSDVDAIVENLQRTDVSAVDHGIAYRRLLDLWGCSQSELARRLSVSETHVSRMLAVLDLPEDVRKEIAAGANYLDALRKRDAQAAGVERKTTRRPPAVPRGTIPTPFGTVKLKRGAKLEDMVAALVDMVEKRKGAA
jgi:ParB family chromosome partitioning protein